MDFQNDKESSANTVLQHATATTHSEFKGDVTDEKTAAPGWPEQIAPILTAAVHRNSSRQRWAIHTASLTAVAAERPRSVRSAWA